MATSIGDLVATLGVNNRPFKAGLTGAQASLSAFATRAKAMLGSVMGMMGVGLGFTGLIYGAKRAIEAATEQEQAEKKLAGVLAATGNAAGFTGKQLQEYAADLQKVTNYGDEATISAMGILASFREIKGDQFKQATALAQDLSAMLDTDLKSSVVMIGKALNDPTIGLTAMSRAGITFNDVQKDMIRNLQKSGDMLGAQKAILAELEHQFGGTAKAMADPLVQMKNRLGDVMEVIGGQLKPAVIAVGEAIAWVFEKMSLGFKIAQWGIMVAIAAIADAIARLTGSDAMRGFAESMAESAENVAKDIDTIVMGVNDVTAATNDAAKGFTSMAEASKTIVPTLKSLASVQGDILAFGQPGWFKQAMGMAGELGRDSPLVAAFVAANQELDAMKEKAAAAAKDKSLGQSVIAATRTPLENLQKEIDDLNRLRSVGALGEGYAGQTTYDRAAKAAREQYEAAIKDPDKKEEPQRERQMAGVLERGSAEAWKKIVGQMYGTGKDKPAEKTANNTEKMAASLTRIENRELEEVGI